MIDNILYSIALNKNIYFLTIDNGLIGFIKENRFPLNHVITPNDLIENK